MDRRSFLRFLGIAPALPIAVKLTDAPAPKPVDVAKFAEPVRGEVLRTTSASAMEWAPIDLSANGITAIHQGQDGQYLVVTANGAEWKIPVYVDAAVNRYRKFA